MAEGLVHIGAESQIVWAVEADIGNSPTADKSDYRTLPITPGESLSGNQSKFISQTLRSDRMRHAMVEGNQNPGGSIPFELILNNYHMFWLLLGGRSTINDGGGAGPYTRSLYGAKNNIDFSTGAANTGTPTITMEKQFTRNITVSGDTGTSAVYIPYKGGRVNSMNITIPQDGFATVSMDMLFTEEGAASATPVYDGGSNAIVDVSEDPVTSVKLGTANGFVKFGDNNSATTFSTIQNMTLNITNNGERIPVIGQKTSYGIEFGTREISGNMTILFQNKDLYDDFLNDTKKEIDIQFDLGTANDYMRIVIPKVQLGQDGENAITPTIDTPGPIVVDFPFIALPETSVDLLDSGVTTVDTDIVVHIASSGASSDLALDLDA